MMVDGLLFVGTWWMILAAIVFLANVAISHSAHARFGPLDREAGRSQVPPLLEGHEHKDPDEPPAALRVQPMRQDSHQLR